MSSMSSKSIGMSVMLSEVVDNHLQWMNDVNTYAKANGLMVVLRQKCPRLGIKPEEPIEPETGRMEADKMESVSADTLARYANKVNEYDAALTIYEAMEAKVDAWEQKDAMLLMMLRKWTTGTYKNLLFNSATSAEGLEKLESEFKASHSFGEGVAFNNLYKLKLGGKSVA